MEHCKYCKAELKDFAHTLPEGLFCSIKCMEIHISNTTIDNPKEYIDMYSEVIQLEYTCADETSQKTLYHKAGIAPVVREYKTDTIRCFTLEDVPKASFGFLISFSVKPNAIALLETIIETNDVINAIFTNTHISVVASCITYPDTITPIDPLVDYLKSEHTRYVFVHSTDIPGALKKILLLEQRIVKIKESLRDPNTFYNLV